MHYTLAPAAVLAGQSAGAWAGAGESRQMCVRPECFACARFDSRYCSDRCGVQVAEAELHGALELALVRREAAAKEVSVADTNHITAYNHI